MLKRNQLSRGFTLLELLVVISIIGILMAMGVVAFSTAQERGRDARRRADMEALQDAQEQYYAANGEYASSGNDLTSGEFLNSIPEDPQSSQNYSLDYDSATYCFCADVEGDDGNSNGADCSWTTGDGTHFCVDNLQ